MVLRYISNLKHRIHSFRIPLSPTGQKIMGFIYFLIPIIAGSFIMQIAFRQADLNIGVNGEKLRVVQNSNTYDSEKADPGDHQKQVLQSMLQKMKER